MDFQRARSEEQREYRRRVILDTTVAMLAEMPVAAVSLNELSRRVGLAKSNVLRYFESREAILLELLDTELRAWIHTLRERTSSIDGDTRARGDRLAATIAETMIERPVMCDLIASQAAVLERNVSTDVAATHKRAVTASAIVVAEVVADVVPDLSAPDAYRVVVVALLVASAVWPHSQPSEALRAVYDADPSVAAYRLSFAEVVAGTIAVQISGLLARQD